MGFPGGLDGKESACPAGDLGLIPGLGRSHGEGNGYPYQYFCPENSVDGGAISYLFLLVYTYDRNQNLPYTDMFQSFLNFYWGVFL